MATRRFAWVLNLDADLELAARHAYTPKRSVREAMRPWRSLLAASLLGPDDVLVDESTPLRSARGLAGRAFCPTPRALAMLVRAGYSCVRCATAWEYENNKVNQEAGWSVVGR